jgi:hypothetical protein
VRNQQLAEAVPFRMETGRGLKSASSYRFSFPESAQLNVLGKAELKSPKPRKLFTAEGKIFRPDLLSPTDS